VVFIVAFGYIISQQLDIHNRNQAGTQLAEEVRQVSTPEVEDTGDDSESEEQESPHIEEETLVEIPIDFAMLQERNPDVHAWIHIPGTDIDYPILQSRDYQEFYLNHDIDRQPDIAGTIFTQDFNGLDFRDVHTLIYGHDMADGSKFGTLNQFLDARFMEEHDIIYIYTPTNIFRYQVVYAVTYDDRHILMSFDFNEDEEYELFIYSLRNSPNVNNHWNPNVTWRVGDSLITLSTCTDNTFQRLLIGAVLIEEF
jgi:sortase B